MAGRGAVVHQSVSALRSLSPPPWLELMVRFGSRPEYTPGIFPVHKNRLPAVVVEQMLHADGHSPELLYARVFPESRHDFASRQVISLLGGLIGFGERVAQRPELVRAALRDSSALKRALAVETFEKLNFPLVPFLDDLARLATGPAKTLRDATGAHRSASRGCPARAGVIAETGKPEERCHALSLIARLNLPEGKALLRERTESETTPSVRKVLSELVSEPRAEGIAPHMEQSEIDVFAGVVVGEATLSALVAWAKGLSKQDLDQAFAWLIDSAPWPVDPPTVLSKPAGRNRRTEESAGTAGADPASCRSAPATGRSAPGQSQ